MEDNHIGDETEEKFTEETIEATNNEEAAKINKRKKQRLLLSVFGVLLVVIAAGFIYYRSLDYEDLFLKEKAKTAFKESTYQTDIGRSKGSFYILCLGIDKTEERESWLGVYRTDTIVLVRVDLDAKRIKVLSIPRDTYTFVPVEKKNDKINHAYAYGSQNGKGVQASIDAVNQLIGNNVVDYYFLMDMEPIPGIVDQIGGVLIDVEIDMKDHGANLSKGLQVLNGKQAFDYIHWRYSARGDIDRIKRQQKFVRELYKQQREKKGILKTIQIVLKYRSSIKTDLSTTQIVGLGKFMSEIPTGNVDYYYIPGDGQTINGISYWVMDKNATQQTLNEFFTNKKTGKDTTQQS